VFLLAFCLNSWRTIALALYPSWPNSVYMGETPTTVAQSSGGDVAGLQFLYNSSFCVSCVPPK
jgi:hypothetical protein